MSMYDENHYNIVISLQLIKINGKKKYVVKYYVVACKLVCYTLTGKFVHKTVYELQYHFEKYIIYD